VLIYKDGTILVNHGGRNGQGLHTKIRQIAAAEFWRESGTGPESQRPIPPKSPIHSATAASAGTDLNGMAVKNAIDHPETGSPSRSRDVLEKNPGTPRPRGAILFENESIFDSRHRARSISFTDAMPLLHLRQVSFSALVLQDAEHRLGQGEGACKPFHYFAFGMAATEVLLDTLTGRHTILRTDILQRCRRFSEPGNRPRAGRRGLCAGRGVVHDRRSKWDDRGNLMTHSPDTYKIPSVQDIPKDFRTRLLQDAPNPNAIPEARRSRNPRSFSPSRPGSR